MVQKLNDLTAGTPEENSTAHALSLTYSRQPNMSSLFNHASMAHNNHFFFEALSPSPPPISNSLTTQLNQDFGSLETLKQTMLSTANAMFGPGFVWLVKAKPSSNATVQSQEQRFRVLCTYLAGSPYAGAHWRQQGTDMNTVANQTAGAFGAFSVGGQRDAALAPGGTGVFPVLCVNTWEHVWLRDWGIFRKRNFVERWWECVDWGVVEARVPKTQGLRGRPFI
ncbi:hypothetical protein LTR66_014306 [Elasticomyces elasticus]|nr:hypothetical protein LTR66_014306 [Elasticomyces elasticus]